MSEYATVPLISHGKGLCHTYVDKDADLSRASDIAFNAKVQRPSVCNAMETLLVHEEVAPALLEPLARRLCDAGVELAGCPRTLELLRDRCTIAPATDEDWDTEYLSLKLSIKVVGSYEEAVEHIVRHGSGHSEAIVTENYSTAMQFLHDVDAAAVLVNASTRLVDGFEFGLGAELGKARRNCMPEGRWDCGNSPVRSSRTGTDSRGLVEMGGSLLEKVRQRVGLMAHIRPDSLRAPRCRGSRVAFDLSR